MEIRPVRPGDLDELVEIDGTIESSQYLHLERAGEGFDLSFRLNERPLREQRIAANRLDDDRRFTVRQIATGADEGLALLAEHDGQKIALLVARLEPEHRTMRIDDLRVDFDHRRQGLATALIYQVVADAREREMRAVMAESRTDNLPAARLLAKCGFDLAGVDTQRHSNHDLVKESATLFWYAALD